MKFSKVLGLFIIVLIISLNFSGSYLYAAQNNTNNTEENNNLNNTNVSNEINSNLMQVNLTGKIPYVNSPSGLGDKGGVNPPWMDKPKLGECGVWKPFMKWFDKKGKDKWYNAWHFWYYIAYPCAAIAETIVYVALLVAWFFVCIAWVLYAIPVTLFKISDFGKSFYLIGWCYNVFNEVKIKDVSRVIQVNNSTIPHKNIVNNTNMSNITILNNTNDSNMSMLNNTNISNMTILNDTINESSILLNNMFNLTEYLISNHYSSGSNNKYENVSNTNIKNCINNFKKQGDSISNTFKVVNGILEGVSNVITLVKVVVKVVTAVSVAVAAVPGGQGAPAAGVSTQVGQVAFDESSEFAFKLISDNIKETLLTKLITDTAKKIDEKNGDKGGKLGARTVLSIQKLEDLIKTIKNSDKSKGDVADKAFGFIRSILKLLTIASELVWDIFSDIQTTELQEELDYRENNNLTVN
jgi:hypothetical protein